MSRKPKKKLSRGELIRRIVMVALILIATGSLGYFVFYNGESEATESKFKKLSGLKNTDFVLFKPAGVTVDEPDAPPEILEDYVTLYNKNKSLIGWIKIDDTIIDYPVMQSPNMEYYLDHNFSQEKDRNGCLFADKDCSIWPRSQNIIIYGHNMKSGKMFGTLTKYKSEDYYKKHPEIQFDTLYEKGTYTVMYVFSEIVHEETEVTFKYYQFINANSAEEYDSYMQDMAEMSLYDTGVTSHLGDQLITLSTCDYVKGGERWVVVAKKIQ
ncbi:MAG: class B sortase [Lachnospiraceae bacterium]|nr:class B sortase [Lachnospiraceae bacterium]